MSFRKIWRTCPSAAEKRAHAGRVGGKEASLEHLLVWGQGLRRQVHTQEIPDPEAVHRIPELRQGAVNLIEILHGWKDALCPLPGAVSHSVRRLALQRRGGRRPPARTFPGSPAPGVLDGLQEWLQHRLESLQAALQFA